MTLLLRNGNNLSSDLARPINTLYSLSNRLFCDKHILFSLFVPSTKQVIGQYLESFSLGRGEIRKSITSFPKSHKYA